MINILKKFKKIYISSKVFKMKNYGYISLIFFKNINKFEIAKFSKYIFGSFKKVRIIKSINEKKIYLKI
ncbi:hypothetical protein ONB67_00565 [Candidatus Vidania fulgoroideae]|uniref:Uncharacterized protein n=1 Tax=Candidatus Vidania fulgoroideorum TaxID=881286 RepID=A0AAX3NBQ1_9PROT|nr:hypothetical protein ONB67_00565 [Candidatus Vidania fulgoroideae]